MTGMPDAFSAGSPDFATGLHMMADLGAALNAARDSADLIRIISEQTIRLINTDVVALSLITATPGVVDYFVTEQNESRHIPNKPIGPATEWVVNQRRALVVADESRDQLPVQPGIVDTGFPEEPRSYIMVPMLVQDDVIGVISVQSYKPDAFGPLELAALSAVASHSAVAVQNAQLLSQRQRLASELGALEAIGYDLASRTELSDVLNAIVHRATGLLRADAAVIYAYHERQGEFQPPPYSFGLPKAEMFLQRGSLPRSNGLTALIVVRNSAIITQVDDTGKREYFEIPLTSVGFDVSKRHPYVFGDQDTSFLDEQQIRSSVGFPLKAGNDLVGVLYISYLNPHEFSEQEEFSTIGRLAQHAALAIQKANIYREIQALHGAGKALTSLTDMDSVLAEIFHQGREVLGADIVTLFPYHVKSDAFDLPPSWSGRANRPEKMNEYKVVRPDDIVRRVVALPDAIFSSKAESDEQLVGTDPLKKARRFVIREDIKSVAAVPLRIEGTVVGAMFFNYRTPQRFGSHHKLLLETFAYYAAAAIHRARLVNRQISELQALAEIDEAIVGGSLPVVLDRVAHLACHIIGAPHGDIFLVDERGEYLTREALVGDKWDIGEAKSFKIGETGVVGWVAQHKRAALVPDVSAPPWNNIYFPGLVNVKSELAVPIKDKDDKVVGVINLESTRVNAFSEEDRRLLVALAEQALIAIQSWRRFVGEQRARQRMEILSKIDELIISASTEHIEQHVDSATVLGDILAQILGLCLDSIGASVGHILLHDKVSNELVIEAEVNAFPEKKGDRQAVNIGIIGMVFTRRTAILAADVLRQPWSEIYYQGVLGIRSEIAVPLLRGDGTAIGVFNAESPNVNAFSQQDVDLLRALAKQAVIAYETVRKYEALRELGAINQLLASGIDPDDVIRRLLIHACTLVRAEWGNLQLYSETGGHLTDYALSSSALEPDPQFIVTSGNELARGGLVGWVAENRRAYYSQADVSLDPIYIPHPSLQIRSEIAVPLVVENELLGVLNLESERLSAFDRDDVERLSDIAVQFALAIQNARNIEIIRESSNRFRILNDVASRLNASLSEEEILQIVLDQGLRRTGAFQATVWVLSEDKTQLEHRLSRGKQLEDHGQPLVVGRFLNGGVAVTHRSVYIPDTDELSGEYEYRPRVPATRSLYIVPLFAGNNYLGNLDLRHHVKNGFKPEELELVNGLAAFAGVGLQRARQERALISIRQSEREAQAMATIGFAAWELAHRIGNWFGLAETHIKTIRADIGPGHEDADRSLTHLSRNVRYLLDLVKRLKTDLETDAKDTLQAKLGIPARVIWEQAIKSRDIPSNIDVTVDDSDDSLVVKADKDIFDAFANIFINSLEALEPRGGKIVLTARQAGGWIEFQITDDGPGIEQEDLNKVFLLFHSSKPDSIGFGLWSARRRILASGGQLGVESTSGQGTTFTIRLPAAGSGVDRE